LYSRGDINKRVKLVKIIICWDKGIIVGVNNPFIVPERTEVGWVSSELYWAMIVLNTTLGPYVAVNCYW
jgi:hypothetical protein